MLKTTGSSNKPACRRHDGSRSVSGRNNGDGEVDKFRDDGLEDAKKLRKSKGQKTSESRKTSKSRKSAKSEKNSLKSGNLPNFGATEVAASFLTPGARETFNRLWLAFTKAPILWHFDPECHIQIETDASDYAISNMLS